MMAAQVAEDSRLSTKYELWSDMPDGYREGVARVAAFQSLAEVVGVLPFAEWMDRVPDYSRKQMFIAKIQDEVGHGHIMARVAEDLGIPREKILADFVEGRTKLLNIFHYGFDSWEEIGIAALLMNSSAIVQFQSLDKGTYLPYVRALKKIEKEEGFHYHHALDLSHQVMVEGSEEQRNLIQSGFDAWFPRLLGYFGPPDTNVIKDNPLYKWGIKVDSNDDIRQRWMSKVIPVVKSLGIHVDESFAKFDEETGRWDFIEVDWAGLRTLISEGGPHYQSCVDAIKNSLSSNDKYRRAALNGGKLNAA
jgi:ring-1,2-phenylacetyl-CoA epoxidase subunit PaaA